MPKFVCSCQYRMNLSNGDNEYEVSIIPEIKINEIIGILEEHDNKIDVDDFIEKIDYKKLDALHCPSCGRFWITDGNGSYDPYVKEI